MQAYIASRQQAVTSMLQLIATTVNDAVPTAAHTERRIHECAFIHYDFVLGVSRDCSHPR